MMTMPGLLVVSVSNFPQLKKTTTTMGMVESSEKCLDRRLVSRLQVFHLKTTRLTRARELARDLEASMKNTRVIFSEALVMT